MPSPFKQYWEFLNLHQPIQKKAKFWMSYGAALKGTENMRAENFSRLHIRRDPLPLDRLPQKVMPDEIPVIKYQEDPVCTRIKAPGYRYESLSRETFGYAPRQALQHSLVSRPTARRPIVYPR